MKGLFTIMAVGSLTVLITHAQKVGGRYARAEYIKNNHSHSHFNQNDDDLFKLEEDSMIIKHYDNLNKKLNTTK